MDKVLEFGKKILKEIIDKNSIVVDATCGNGNDTLFLAMTSAKKIYAFDIQQLAITNTKQILEKNNCLEKCELIMDGHENILKYVDDKIKCAIFNLGYLPLSNHNITTEYKTTIQAIENILTILEVGGRIVVVVYWGHQKGKEEKIELLNYVAKLDQKKIEVLKYQFVNQKNNAPFLLVLEKIKN